MKHFYRTVPLLVTLLFFSCTEDLETEPEAKPVAFERVRNLVWARGDVGNLAIFHDQLYYSNNSNPGYFTREGEHMQFGARSYNMEMGQVLSEDFTIAVNRDLRFFEFIPTVNYASNYKNPVRVEDINGMPEGALIGNSWYRIPNFGINGNHFLAGFDYRWGSGKALILELDIRELFNKHLAYRDPVLNQTEINLQIDGFGISNLISVYPYKEGWLASASIAGYMNTFYITIDGNAKRIPDESSIERFVLTSFHETPDGKLYGTTENGIIYSSTGQPEDFELIATGSFSTMKIRFVGDRMVMFYNTDQIYEILHYNDPEHIALLELDNTGLEGLLVRDITEFNGKAWVATNAGLFTKPLEDFWQEKQQPKEEMQNPIVEFIN